MELSQKHFCKGYTYLSKLTFIYFKCVSTKRLKSLNLISTICEDAAKQCRVIKVFVRNNSCIFA